MRTLNSQRPTLVLIEGGLGKNGSASTNSGLKSQDLTVKQIIRNHQLMASLNLLEKKAEYLLNKSCEVLDTFLNDTMTHLVEPTTIQDDSVGTR